MTERQRKLLDWALAALLGLTSHALYAEYALGGDIIEMRVRLSAVERTLDKLVTISARIP